jgi:hypothetical protein
MPATDCQADLYEWEVDTTMSTPIGKVIRKCEKLKKQKG